MTKNTMPRGIPLVSQEVRGQILKRIREEGVSVAQAAEEHGIKPWWVCGWERRL